MYSVTIVQSSIYEYLFKSSWKAAAKAVNAAIVKVGFTRAKICRTLGRETHIRAVEIVNGVFSQSTYSVKTDIGEIYG
jgi:hypothetical protein